MSRLAALGASTAIVVTLLLGLEVGLRTVGPFLPGAYRTGSQYELDEELGWRHARDTTLWFRSPEYLVRVTLDAEGRRVGPQRNGPTVALLGDSFVEAAQVADDKTLAARLAAALPGTVLNDGVGGYGTDQEVVDLERRYQSETPSLAILVFAVSNDVWNNDWSFEQLRTVWGKPHFELDPSTDDLVRVPLPSGQPSLSDRLRLGLARSAALAALKSGILPDRADPAFRHEQLGVLREASGEWLRAWRITEFLLARADRSAAAMGTPLLLVAVPDGCQVHVDLCGPDADLAPSDRPQRRLEAIAGRAGIPMLDLLPLFRARAAAGERLYFRTDLHWNAKGQEIAAEAILPVARDLMRSRPGRPTP